MMTKQNHLVTNAKRAVLFFASGILLFLSLIITFFYLSSAAAAAEKNAVTSTVSTSKETEKKAQISLTQEEREWLSAKPHIKLATLTNQPPFSMMSADRTHTGILADILALLSDAIGQRIETKLVANVVSDTHAVAKEEGIYGSASLLRTARHAKEYLLTDPYYTTPYYIYTTTTNLHEIRRPDDLRGKRLAVSRNHRAVAAYLAGIGDVQTVPADTPVEQMQKVVSGEADALIGYFTYPYLVNKYLMVDLEMAFVAKSDQHICFGVNPEHSVLHAILNKAIATLEDYTVNAIAAKWTETKREETPEVDLTPEEQAWLAEHPGNRIGSPHRLSAHGDQESRWHTCRCVGGFVRRRQPATLYHGSPAHRRFMGGHSGKGAKQGDRRIGHWRKGSEPGRSLQCNRYPGFHLLFCFCTLPKRVSIKALLGPEGHARRV